MTIHNMNDNKYQLSFINQNKPTPEPTETVVSGKEYILFGEDNRYTDTLWDCYQNCSLLQSITNGLSDYIAGSGIDQDKPINKTGEMLSELVYKCAVDYVIFGAFTVQLLRNQFGKVCELWYVDVRKCRLDADGKYVFYASKGWERYTRNVRKYDRWNASVNSNNSILYFKSPKSRNTYGLPIWNAALKDVLTLMEISNFHYNSIKNNFTPSAMINFKNGVPTEEEQDLIERRITDKFCGSDNASKFVLTFSDNADSAPSIERLAYDDFGDRYLNLKQTAKENLFVAFRATPRLFGVESESTGFSTDEYKDTFKLFKKTVSAPMQTEIENAFEKIGFIFKLNEFEVEFDSDNNVQTPTIDNEL